MDVQIITLTPLWTGGVDGTTDRLHESGLLGSLRWWYEAIVRGLGGEACDPSQGTCIFDTEKYQKSSASAPSQRLRDAGLCDVCQVFGATGWRRRFRLRVVDDKTQSIWAGPQPLNIRPRDRTRGWFLPPGRMGAFILRLTGDTEVVQRIAALLLFLERWGNLGARAQLGYGAFRVDNREDVLAAAKQANWNTISASQSTSADPDLRQFLFFRFDFTPVQPGWWTTIPGISRVSIQVQPLVQRYNIVPVTPALKNIWRFGRQWNRNDERIIFGASHPDRRRGRITATWAYCIDSNSNQWRVHGWAWLPAQSHIANTLTQTLGNAATWSQTLNVQGTLTQQQPQTTQAVRQLL
ncbi:MAG: type III-B CRISPR module RAMP protein Cmr1 [Roseiflexus sp.]|jgi:CRISPR-associated protein Cmr1|nr:type III-B CRISPR module RAMP protein Cmr1 [Chloroflexus sp.]MBO9337082.1 type III-B CRISPR module RAMP protein Cmr1 [Roseiflexus sp.]MBO9343603.1 type III-B CRISPR module RAMP protein Cmr1 [Roseiflexus sp.]